MKLPKKSDLRVDYKTGPNDLQYSVLVDYVKNTILFFEFEPNKTLEELYSEFKYIVNSPGLPVYTTKFVPVLRYLEFQKLPNVEYTDC